MPYSVWPSAATRATPASAGVVALPPAVALSLSGNVPTIVASGDFTTTFPTVESPISQSGKWKNGAANGTDWHNMQVTANGAVGTSLMGSGSARYADNIAILDSTFRTFNNNQRVKGTVYCASGYTGGGGNHEVELLLRFSISANDAHGYEVLWGIQGYLAVVKWNGALGSYTPILDPGAGSIPPYVDGDTLEARLTGTTLQVLRNGVTVPGFGAVDLTAGGTISAWSSGQPGMGTWPVDGSADYLKAGWKSYLAGDL